MFYMNIYDKSTGNAWVEYFDNYTDLVKRENKLKFSKKLFSLSWGRSER